MSIVGVTISLVSPLSMMVGGFINNNSIISVLGSGLLIAAKLFNRFVIEIFFYLSSYFIPRPTTGIPYYLLASANLLLTEGILSSTNHHVLTSQPDIDFSYNPQTLAKQY